MYSISLRLFLFNEMLNVGVIENDRLHPKIEFIIYPRARGMNISGVLI